MLVRGVENAFSASRRRHRSSYYKRLFKASSPNSFDALATQSRFEWLLHLRAG